MILIGTHQNTILGVLGQRTADERSRGRKVGKNVLTIVVGYGDVQCV